MNESQALVRKINAEADLLQAQAEDIRANARHRNLVCDSMTKINELQTLQVQAQIDALKNATPPAN